MPSRPRAVYGMLVAGLFSISISAILVRYAAPAPALAVAVWRTTWAVLMLAPVALPRLWANSRAFSRSDALWIVVAGVLLGLHFITWIESLYHTSVASASVLVASSPIFLGIFGYLFLHERLHRRTIGAIGIGVLGAGLIGWGDAGDATFPNALLGNGLALSAALFFTFYLLIGRVIRQRASWLAYVFPLYGVVALTVGIAAWWRQVPVFGYDLEFYGLCALMAIGPQIIGHGSFNYAVRYFTPAVLGLLSLSEPVLASVLAFFLFGEWPTALAVAGMLLVLGSIALALWRRRRVGPDSEQGEA